MLVKTVVLSFVVASTVALAQTPATPKPSLADDLHANRTELHINPTTSTLSGPGRDILVAAIAPAHFVFLGEDHITREIPAFASAMCDLFRPTALALETSPQVAQFTESLVAAPDRVARMRAVTDRFPFSVAFLDVREEQDFAAHCATTNPKLHIWGLDQTFIGSAPWILDEILATHPGPNATVAIQHLQQLDAEATATVRKEPKRYDKLFLLTITEDQIASTTTLLAKEGSPRAQWLFHELAISHNIYGLNIKGSPDSNFVRANLLKHNLQHDLDAAGPIDSQRVLLKFGDMHGYRGYDPLHQRDLGNFVAEFADLHDTRSIHIILSGAKGQQRNYTGFGLPTELKPFTQSDNDMMKPFLEAAFTTPGAWTVFDLRPLRFGKHRPTDVDIQRLVDGYDLFIVIPETTPANLIDELPSTTLR